MLTSPLQFLISCRSPAPNSPRPVYLSCQTHTHTHSSRFEPDCCPFLPCVGAPSPIPAAAPLCTRIFEPPLNMPAVRLTGVRHASCASEADSGSWRISPYPRESTQQTAAAVKVAQLPPNPRPSCRRKYPREHWPRQQEPRNCGRCAAQGEERSCSAMADIHRQLDQILYDANDERSRRLHTKQQNVRLMLSSLRFFARTPQCPH